ncbi:MAG: right-handed parallel beta-helix repeat-containing protein [Candidatus Eisenbacteria bacterium]|uniref:Right-handed parallel beta-helix repeat-containing protein n=1 Tax=Eiseniibacteriota bacterium TaxID=2212470 RepID=A0A948W6A2_UNCEI|nr:right-handed parallel beta-helix repeat-containing protein [Candidatus Eisenbacteria bacterium]MBU1947868.1 right-handed parallel beta-helix repeat-containing protein [Candidatus Eisenbacteria bacterium]MBU2690895.1 right-handed parallel beta-helix repeat-containing protein [Candidatus Eisenbacteria bacterium]
MTFHRYIHGFYFLFILAVFSTPRPAASATRHVPSEFPTIQGAVDYSTPGDTVLITCDIYEESEIILNPGIIIRGDGAAEDCVIIDAQQSGRSFYCNDLIQTVRIENLTIRAGSANTGGAIYCNNSSLHITDCTFEQNTAVNGGAIWCNDSSPVISDCTFEQNTASGLGGGLYFQQDSAPVFADCLFYENTAGSGGGIFFNTTLEAEIVDCTFSKNNSVNWGGGIATGNVAPVVTNCTFYRNSGTEGSGIMVLSSGHLRLNNSIIGYGTGAGKAVECRGSAIATLTCCDVYGNSGGDYAGCIGNQNGLDGNISASPVFCDMANNDLTLRIDSKCAPYSLPNSQCALIGAWPVRCNIPNPVHISTWGSIKALYK